MRASPRKVEQPPSPRFDSVKAAIAVYSAASKQAKVAQARLQQRRPKKAKDVNFLRVRILCGNQPVQEGTADAEGATAAGAETVTAAISNEPAHEETPWMALRETYRRLNRMTVGAWVCVAPLCP